MDKPETAIQPALTPEEHAAVEQVVERAIRDFEDWLLNPDKDFPFVIGLPPKPRSREA